MPIAESESILYQEALCHLVKANQIIIKLQSTEDWDTGADLESIELQINEVITRYKRLKE